MFVNSLSAMAEDASGEELHDLLVAATAVLSVLYARNNVLEIFDHVSGSTPTPTPTGSGSGVRTVGEAVGGAVVRCLGTSEEKGSEETKHVICVC